jgi:hypothetical protein
MPFNLNLALVRQFVNQPVNLLAIKMGDPTDLRILKFGLTPFSALLEYA